MTPEQEIEAGKIERQLLRDAIAIMYRSILVAEEKEADGAICSASVHMDEAKIVAEMVLGESLDTESGYTPSQAKLRYEVTKEWMKRNECGSDS
jgi:hypothetical protein